MENGKQMQRRDFCKLIAASAAATGLPATAQSTQSMTPGRVERQQTGRRWRTGVTRRVRRT